MVIFFGIMPGSPPSSLSICILALFLLVDYAGGQVYPSLQWFALNPVWVPVQTYMNASLRLGVIKGSLTNRTKCECWVRVRIFSCVFYALKAIPGFFSFSSFESMPSPFCSLKHAFMEISTQILHWQPTRIFMQTFVEWFTDERSRFVDQSAVIYFQSECSGSSHLPSLNVYFFPQGVLSDFERPDASHLLLASLFSLNEVSKTLRSFPDACSYANCELPESIAHQNAECWKYELETQPPSLAMRSRRN